MIEKTDKEIIAVVASIPINIWDKKNVPPNHFERYECDYNELHIELRASVGNTPGELFINDIGFSDKVLLDELSLKVKEAIRLKNEDTRHRKTEFILQKLKQ